MPRGDTLRSLGDPFGSKEAKCESTSQITEILLVRVKHFLDTLEWLCTLRCEFPGSGIRDRRQRICEQPDVSVDASRLGCEFAQSSLAPRGLGRIGAQHEYCITKQRADRKYTETTNSIRLKCCLLPLGCCCCRRNRLRQGHCNSCVCHICRRSPSQRQRWCRPNWNCRSRCGRCCPSVVLHVLHRRNDHSVLQASAGIEAWHTSAVMSKLECPGL